MLDKIEAFKSSLSKSEKRVADHVLIHPDETIRSSLTALAATVGVSQPTVIRFCRAVGYRGFQDFKLNLAQSLASRARYFHPRPASPPPASDPYRHSIEAAIGTLTALHNAVDVRAMDRAVAALTGATQVVCFGPGTALLGDAQQRLLDIGVAAVSYPNGRMQVQAARVLDPAAVVLVVAPDGGHGCTLEAAALARRAAVEVVGLCPDGSALAAECSLLLTRGVAVDSGLAYGVLLDTLLNVLRQRLTAETGR